MWGPTQTAELGGADRWRPRPGLASALRFTILALPTTVSFGVTFLIARAYSPEDFDVDRLTWWIGVAVLGVTTLVATDRLARRFLPLTTLLRLSLVFPDEAPSRYRQALRRGTTAQLRRRIDDHLAADKKSDEVAHGQYMLDLVEAVNRHDRATRGHSERVRAYTMMIAEEMGLAAADREKLQWAALLHDVGKLDVPSEILNKDGRPGDAEWEILAGHPAAAIPYLEPLKPWLGDWLRAADEHHLRWDGQGYPSDTAGTDISLAGRIVAVADAYDVMTSARSYKKPMPPEDARVEIARCAGGQFDPAVTRAFLNVGLGRLRLAGGPISWLGHTIGFEAAPVGLGTAVAGTAAQVSVGVAATMGGVVTADVIEPDPPPAAVAYVEVDEADATAPTTNSPAQSPTTATTPPTTIPPTTAPSTTTTATAPPTTTTIPPTTSPTTGPTTTTTTTTTMTTTVPAGDPPNAQNDYEFLVRDIPENVGVLQNDEAGSNPIHVPSLRIVREPANGTATVNGANIRYTPGPGYLGLDSVRYEICDRADLCDNAWLTLTVVP